MFDRRISKAAANHSFTASRPASIARRSAEELTPEEAHPTAGGAHALREARAFSHLSLFPPGRPSAPIQPKLVVGHVDDPLEREADHVADQVMRMEAPARPMTAGPDQLSRKCAACEEEQAQTVRPSSDAASEASGREAPEIVSEVLGSSGKPLDPAARAFFEPRFGHDFSSVRVHSDSTAAEASRSIGARAFTQGDHIAFAAGQYDPSSVQGRSLLAHELTHVVQQSGGSQAVRRDLFDDAKKTLGEAKKAAEKKAEGFAASQLGSLASEPLGPPSGFVGGPHCPPNFCQPFADKTKATANLAWAGPLILAGIAKKVNPRVVPLWASYLTGGSAPKTLSADFGKDFTASPTTATTTKFLINALRKDIEANQVALMGGAKTVTLDFTPRLSAALAEINDPKGPDQMNFNFPADIAGNLAGGIGTDQLAHRIGATPSPFNDSREATIQATLTRNPDGSLNVAPAISFTVKDTIDLCPGDCGTKAEQVATVPLSRFEATGLTGDVPMIIQFDAPAAELAPFDIAAPAPPPAPAGPVPGTVTASHLNIRASPSTAAPVVGSYPSGTSITVQCQTTGTLVDGNDVWFQTDKGYVSARYVTLTGPTAPAAC